MRITGTLATSKIRYSRSPPSDCNLKSAWSCQIGLDSDMPCALVLSPSLRPEDPSGNTFHATRAAQNVASGMRAHYCCCDICLGSVIDVSDGDGAHTLSDDTKEAWEGLFAPSSSLHRDLNRAPTEVAPSTPVPPEEEAPSIPETPRFPRASHWHCHSDRSQGWCHPNTSCLVKAYSRSPGTHRD